MHSSFANPSPAQILSLNLSCQNKNNPDAVKSVWRISYMNKVNKESEKEKETKLNQCPDLSALISLCPDGALRSPTGSPGERFPGTFCTSPSPCLQVWFFRLSSLPGSAHVLLSLSKTDSKTEFTEGLWKQRLLKSPWESLGFSQCLYAGTRVKKSERTQILIHEQDSHSCEKRRPQKPGGATQERREKSKTKSNKCWKSKQPTAPFDSEISQHVRGFRQSHKPELIRPEKKRITHRYKINTKSVFLQILLWDPYSRTQRLLMHQPTR